MFRLIAGGLLALPPLLVMVVTAPIVAVLSLPGLFFLRFRKAAAPKARCPDHVVITGGSSGIGLSIAKEAILRGVPKITLLARNKAKLEAAKKQLDEVIKEHKKTCQVAVYSASVNDYPALQGIADAVCKKDPKDSSTVTTALFHCAGIPYTTYYDQVPMEEYDSLIHTNQLGAIKVTRAFLRHMEAGIVVFCSSVAGQIGTFGYTAYSPTKFALRGFAESLHMELCHKPIHVQIAFPTDTDTPGYQEEMKMMPPETQALNDAVGLGNPDDTAKHMVNAAFVPHPEFMVYFTFETWMLSGLVSGMSPVVSFGSSVTQVACMSLFRMVSLFYLNDFWRILRKMAAAREEKNKEQKTYGATSDGGSSPTTSSAKQD